MQNTQVVIGLETPVCALVRPEVAGAKPKKTGMRFEPCHLYELESDGLFTVGGPAQSFLGVLDESLDRTIGLSCWLAISDDDHGHWLVHVPRIGWGYHKGVQDLPVEHGAQRSQTAILCLQIRECTSGFVIAIPRW